MVLIGQKWLYLGKKGSIRAKVVVFEKVVVSVHKWLFLGQKICIRAKNVVFEQSC